MKTTPETRFCGWSLFVYALCGLCISATAADPKLTFKTGDRIAILGGALAERSQYFGHIEMRIQIAFPDLALTIRNMGWSGDEVGFMPRPLNFGTLEEQLADKKADVIFLCFGRNEALQGESGIKKFISDYEALIKQITPQTGRFVFISPIAREKLPNPWPDFTEQNRILEKYTEAIRGIARKHKQPFIDLFHPTRTLMAENYSAPLTSNGIHLTEEGYHIVAEIIVAEMNWPQMPQNASSEILRKLIIEKNQQFQRLWRPMKEGIPLGRSEIAQLDKQIHAVVTGKIDDLQQKRKKGSKTSPVASNQAE